MPFVDEDAAGYSEFRAEMRKKQRLALRAATSESDALAYLRGFLDRRADQHIIVQTGSEVTHLDLNLEHIIKFQRDYNKYNKMTTKAD